MWTIICITLIIPQSIYRDPANINWRAKFPTTKALIDDFAAGQMLYKSSVAQSLGIYLGILLLMVVFGFIFSLVS